MVTLVWLAIFAGICVGIGYTDRGRFEYGIDVIGIGVIYPIFAEATFVTYIQFGLVAVVATVIFAATHRTPRRQRRRAEELSLPGGSLDWYSG